MATTTVIGVPGPWDDAGELRRALVDQGVLYAGKIMMELGVERGAVVDLRSHDPAMEEAFRAGGAYSSMSEVQYRAIGTHRSCCYVVDENAGTVESASRLARLALALIHAGGLGVKVESAGKAHAPDDWRDLFGNQHSDAVLVDGYVVYVGSRDNGYYSCGMHNLGWPDAVAPAMLGPRDAHTLLDAFCRFELLDRPTLRSGETFATGPGERTYRLRHKPSQFEPRRLVLERARRVAAGTYLSTHQRRPLASTCKPTVPSGRGAVRSVRGRMPRVTVARAQGRIGAGDSE